MHWILCSESNCLTPSCGDFPIHFAESNVVSQTAIQININLDLKKTKLEFLLSDMWTEGHYDNKLLTSQQHHYDAEKLSHHGYANVVDKATESHGNAHDQTTAIFDMDLKEIKKEGQQIQYYLIIFNNKFSISGKPWFSKSCSELYNSIQTSSAIPGDILFNVHYTLLNIKIPTNLGLRIIELCGSTY